MENFHGTTILMLRHKGQMAVCGDGQVTLQGTVVKSTAKKIRRLHQGKVLCGFAGATADALAIMERFENQLTQHNGHLTKAAVELAKSWRTDKSLRRLEAVMLACDARGMLLISGSGDVLEPDDWILSTGSGGNFALAAGRAMIRHSPGLSAAEIAQESLRIASEICVYTNDRLTLEVLDCEGDPAPGAVPTANPTS
ncbi:MAG: ATP-dependent protease subunit HslV [Deltaproteobacteria bacterium]|jgi:ATP-dependent HslUV protease subunit HslV|nr:ATP-dependent protease subunit HslV [Deltaproteobacteria bacterium]